RRYLVECPAPYRGAERFRDRLRDRLARCVGKAEGATVAEIAGALARQGVPVLIQAHLSTDEWCHGGSGPFECFVRFWADWPALGVEHPLLACLAVTYRLGHGFGWIERLRLRRGNQGLRRYLAELDPAAVLDVRGLVLDELLGITQIDVENWA